MSSTITRRSKVTDKVSPDVDALVTFVVETYLATPGTAATVRQIAAGLSWPEAKVRRVVDLVFDVDRGWRRIKPTTVEVERREKSYRTVIGYRSATAYEPTLTHLAAMVVELRDAKVEK